jgi:nicotinate-nucleotide adenylyltransferase
VKIGVLAGAFNPVTRAHVELAESARAIVDQIVCVLPRTYPHKDLHGADLDQRLEMLHRIGHRGQITEGGLFIDIARELRRSNPQGDLYFICGRDAAERVLTWDYGQPAAINRMLEEFHLLVAARHGHFDPPPHLRHRIHALNTTANLDEVSSTEVRRRIAATEPWEHLVPEPIVDMVREIYLK